MNRMRHPGEAQTCPKCGYVFKELSSMDAPGTQPAAGDYSLCSNCGEVLKFDAAMKLLPLTETDVGELDPESKLRILFVKTAFEMVKRQDHGKEWLLQMQQMARRALEWRIRNPGRTVTVQFNFPPQAMLIAEISSALEQKLVSANEAGRELIAALWAQNVATEPTVFMVRMAIELSESMMAETKEGTNE